MIRVEAEAPVDVDDAGNAEPDRDDARARLDRDPQLRVEQLQERLAGQAGGGRRPACEPCRPRPSTTPTSIFVPPRSTPIVSAVAGRFVAGRGHEAGIREGMRQYYRVMAPGDSERPDRPEYNVYKAGGRGRGRRAEPKQDEQTGKPEGSGDGARSQAPSEGPGYSVYKARRGFKRSGSDGPSLRDRLSRGGGSKPRPPGEKPRWRVILKWVAIAAGRLAADQLRRLLDLGADPEGQAQRRGRRRARRVPVPARPGPEHPRDRHRCPARGRPTRPAPRPNPKCVDAAASKAIRRPRAACPSRADTLMVVHAGGGSFSKISIPRDTLASIPGEGDQQDQRRLRVRRRGAADQDRRGLPRDRHQPRRDPRLRGLRRLHRRDRRRHGQPPRHGQIADQRRRDERRRSR